MPPALIQVHPPVAASTIKPHTDFKDLPRKLVNASKEERARLLRGLHERFWHASAPEMQKLLHALGLPPYIVRVAAEVVHACPTCRKFALPKHKPLVKGTLTTRFNERVLVDLFFLWDCLLEAFFRIAHQPINTSANESIDPGTVAGLPVGTWIRRPSIMVYL